MQRNEEACLMKPIAVCRNFGGGQAVVVVVCGREQLVVFLAEGWAFVGGALAKAPALTTQPLAYSVEQ